MGSCQPCPGRDRRSMRRTWPNGIYPRVDEPFGVQGLPYGRHLPVHPCPRRPPYPPRPGMGDGYPSIAQGGVVEHHAALQHPAVSVVGVLAKAQVGDDGKVWASLTFRPPSAPPPGGFRPRTRGTLSARHPEQQHRAKSELGQANAFIGHLVKGQRELLPGKIGHLLRSLMFSSTNTGWIDCPGRREVSWSILRSCGVV